MGVVDQAKSVAGIAGDVAKKSATQAGAVARKSATQASQVAMRGATQAQDALQGLVNDLRLRRKADSLARQLGYLIAHEPKGKTALKDEVDHLAEEIRGLEHRIAESAPPDDEPGDDGSIAKTRH